MPLLLICSFGMLAGLFIGAAGIGGVILVPLLVYAGGIEIHISIAASVASFCVSGIVGTIVYWRRGLLNWSDFIFLASGAVPGALLGSFILPKVDGDVLTFFIALILLATSLRQFHSSQNSSSKNTNTVSLKRMVLIGGVTGFFSVLSGTGGPLVLVPLLLWLSFPVISAIALSQAIQLPISAFATIGNEVNSLIDWPLVLLLSFGLAIGSFVGAKTAFYLPVENIKKLVAALLFCAGLYMFLNVLFTHL